MTPEGPNNQLPDWLRQQQARDELWVRENYDLVGTVAVTSYELGGRGAIVVDASQWLPEGPPPPHVAFDYVSQERIENLGSQITTEMVKAYNPEKEFIVIFLKPQYMISSYYIQMRQRARLLDAETRARLPALYSGEALGLEALALVKFFTPDSDWAWYASELDGDDIFFGLVAGFAVELGYFSLHELETLLGPTGLPVERDQHFEPQTFRQLQQLYRQRGS